MDLIHQKLVSDLKEHFKDNELNDIIDERVAKKLEDVNLDIKSSGHYRNDSRNIDDEKRCQARLWNDHCEGRCKNKKRKEGLCLRHSNMLLEKGSLEFGTICEDKPTRNKDGKRLSWYEGVTTIDDHITLLREENKKRILHYIIYHMSKTDSS